jgi:hypothetical protein
MGNPIMLWLWTHETLKGDAIVVGPVGNEPERRDCMWFLIKEHM